MKSIVMASLLALTTSAATYAGDDVCFGRVTGVSDRYNPAKGSGFLALRAGPTPSATQLGELFQGDRVVVLKRRGGWLNIIADNQQQGWVSSKYISSSCK